MFHFLFSHEDTIVLMVQLKKLSWINKITEYVSRSCDTSFLYWHRMILPSYFEHLFETKYEAYRLNVRCPNFFDYFI